jgi:acyl-CoA oxidase
MDGRGSVQFGDVEHQSWLADFQAHVNDLPELLAGDGGTPLRAAARLRRLVAKRALSLTDLRDAPERFFSAHHVLSEFATRLGPGFGIRFTVQYNLFAGSVLALGTTGV